MKKRERDITRFVAMMFLLFAIILFTPSVSGEYIVSNSTGGGGFNYSLGNVELYNFSINNTFSNIGSNLTKVSIVLPLNINYISGQGSSSSSLFTNTTNSEGRDVLNWTSPTGEALVMNNSKESFWFQANSTSEGSEKVDIYLENSTSISNEYLDVNIYSQDSSPESIDINVISPEEGEYFDTNAVWINATANTSIDEWKINFNGTNFTGINRSFNIEDGDYDLIVYANSGGTGEEDSVSFSVDTSTPEINITSPLKTLYNNNSIWFNFTSNEYMNRWIVNYNATSGDNQTFDGSGEDFSQKLEVPKGQWELYVYGEDFAGNTGFDSLLFSVNSSLENESEETNDSSREGFWTLTYSETDVDLSTKENIVKDCGKGERIEIKVKDNLYYIGVVEINETVTVINISDNDGNVISNRGQEIGDRIEYDLEEDGKRDILLVVNGITDNKATITVKASYSLEPIPDFNQTSNQTSNQSSNETDNGSEEDKTAKVFIIVVGGIFVVCLIGILYYVKKHQREEAEKRFKEKTTIYENPDDLVGQES